MRDMLELGLEQHGFDVRSAPDGAAALAVLDSGWRPDAIVLDVVMPKIGGMDLLPQLRRGSEVPIVMLSARKEVPDKIAALAAGADDYVGKPFDLGELAARLYSRVRRPKLSKPQSVSYADVAMDLETRQVTRAGRMLSLTAREFDLLAVFVREPGRVFTRDQLLDQVWGFEAAVEPNVVETYVSYLRAKLGEPPLIRTIRRVGYTMRAD
ncbi:MAG: response regulator transcription factor [Candidatus Eremiobacteraeota bacterium]|nr:response regulator transcription factor [Candidatus Eremiobacteraeota bacterium]